MQARVSTPPYSAYRDKPLGRLTRQIGTAEYESMKDVPQTILFGRLSGQLLDVTMAQCCIQRRSKAELSTSTCWRAIEARGGKVFRLWLLVEMDSETWPKRAKKDGNVEFPRLIIFSKDGYCQTSSHMCYISWHDGGMCTPLVSVAAVILGTVMPKTTRRKMRAWLPRTYNYRKSTSKFGCCFLGEGEAVVL